MGDSVAVDSRLAVWRVGNGVGDESHVGGGVLEVLGKRYGEYLVPITFMRGFVLVKACYDAGTKVVGLVVVGCEVGEVGVYCRCGLN